MWNSLADIVMGNLLLSGDNAVLIALAAHSLPKTQQRPAIILGGAAAIIMRALLTIFAIRLLTLPYIKIVGGILLFWIAIKLIVQQHKTVTVESSGTIAGAIKTILIADLVMSVDNVLGVAAAAKGSVPLLIAGLVLSIPLIVFGSTFVLHAMQKFKFLLLFGGALLGYLGGELLFSDQIIQGMKGGILSINDLEIASTGLRFNIPGAACAIVAVVTGLSWSKIKNKQRNPQT